MICCRTAVVREVLVVAKFHTTLALRARATWIRCIETLRRELWTRAVASSGDQPEEIVAPGQYTLVASTFTTVTRYHRPSIDAVLTVIAAMERPRTVIDNVVAEFRVMPAL